MKTYEGQDGDIANGIADLDLDNEQGESRQRGKYMRQLVCAVCVMDGPIFSDSHLKQRIANRDQQMLVIDLEDISDVSSVEPSQ